MVIQELIVEGLKQLPKYPDVNDDPVIKIITFLNNSPFFPGRPARIQVDRETLLKIAAEFGYFRKSNRTLQRIMVELLKAVGSPLLRNPVEQVDLKVDETFKEAVEEVLDTFDLENHPFKQKIHNF